MSEYVNRDRKNRTTVRVIVERDEDILVIKRRRYGEEYIVLPGGGIDESDSVEETACREVFEETRVVVDEPKVLATIKPSENFGLQYIVRCRYLRGEPFLDPQSEEAKRSDDGQNTYEPCWIAKVEAKDTILPAEARPLI
jgi:8-oxo-dGTP pyrophosphatase MutT (NUDIX family)